MITLTSKTLTVLSAVLALYLSLGCTTGRTIDEIIASASTDVTNFDMLTDASGSVLRTELDMLLTADQYLALYGKQDPSSPTGSRPSRRNKRKATKSLTTRWTNKQIPYKIEPFTFSSSDIATIKSAIKEWETATCITFPPATSADHNYINFADDGSGCASYVGMLNSGNQTVSLGYGCIHMGLIAHEIGHAVGFVHEQSRPDRDDHIIIKWENIASEKLYENFDKHKWSDVSIYDVPYDYKSIMHYGGRAFSGNGQYTIVTIDPAFQDVIGNRNGLSFNDIKLANLMYNCSETCRASISCPPEGFLGKDCQCWCPGDPVKNCAESSTVRPTLQPTERPTMAPTMRPTMRPTVQPTPRPTCTDETSNCPAWAESGFCQSTPYMETFCKKSCSFCGDTPPTTTKVCEDDRSNCKIWAINGFCDGIYSQFMHQHCPVTCGVCKQQANKSMAMSVKTDTAGGSVTDN
ncbi:hypothetical protein BsWGS_18727 [Bradybaena similaris]